jgi:hypothetical protein
MSAASFAPGNYPIRLNKRESKVVETALANAALLVSHYIVMAKLATNVSATVDFGALAVGDRVLHCAVIGSLVTFATVATAGTNPEGAAVVDDLYIALRAKV